MTCSYTRALDGSVSRQIEYPDGGGNSPLSEFPGQEPNHAFYPLFLRRPAVYNEQINEQAGNQVGFQWQNLPARLDRLMDATNPASAVLAQAMLDVVGIKVTAVQSQNGKVPGSYVQGGYRTLIDRMGAGVANAVTLLACLLDSRGKIFLIEEPETDLHPAALKPLLHVIEQVSDHNQFFISTHSHVVVRYLTSNDNARLFHVTAQIDDSQLYTSSVAEVPRTP
jgi:predicted ATP-binding protein involved in virulence